MDKDTSFLNPWTTVVSFFCLNKMCHFIRRKLATHFMSWSFLQWNTSYKFTHLSISFFVFFLDDLFLVIFILVLTTFNVYIWAGVTIEKLASNWELRPLYTFCISNLIYWFLLLHVLSYWSLQRWRPEKVPALYV